MNIDNLINKYVDKEKKEEHSPYLESRIMAGLKALPAKKQCANTVSRNIWQSIAVIASIAIVIMLGINIGNITKTTPGTYYGLVVNDNQLEQFSIYTDIENEDE